MAKAMCAKAAMEEKGESLGGKPISIQSPMTSSEKPFHPVRANPFGGKKKSAKRSLAGK